MPASESSAPGKVILFGEHAVVYGRPALAVPVNQIKARVLVEDPGQNESWIEAPDIGLNSPLKELSADHPLLLAVQQVTTMLGPGPQAPARIKISSTIPIASGLGSGAAVSVALARALSAYWGRPLADEQVSELAYRIDQNYHGTPSGIDNTVIAYAQPVWYVRGQPFERLFCAAPFHLVIADTGISSPTAAAVGDVRRRWSEAPEIYEAIFDRIGEIACQARKWIEAGQPDELGPLMQANHTLLQNLDVSCPELDRLVSSAMRAGALGAKLCGGGRGGNMIALVRPETAEAVASALVQAGARRTISTRVE